MITCVNNKNTEFENAFTEGNLEGFSDVMSKYKTEGSSCGAYGLLEASLGYCLTITVRKFAENHNIPLEGINTRIHLDLSDSDNPVIEKNIELIGELSDIQRQKLLKASETCCIFKMLSKSASFKN